MTPIRNRPIVFTQLVFTLLVAAFLIVPAVQSMLAGVTVNYFQGVRSGLTLQWVAQVWELYAATIFRSFLIAFATLVVTLVVGIPAAYALHLRNDRLSRAVEEIITLPLAIPGLALALGLLLTYGSFSDFRRSWLFILAGHAAGKAIMADVPNMMAINPGDFVGLSVDPAAIRLLPGESA
jgi:putative spermidine/putrescine transport system permease protein